jgi:hypothetical protein
MGGKAVPAAARCTNAACGCRSCREARPDLSAYNWPNGGQIMHEEGAIQVPSGYPVRRSAASLCTTGCIVQSVTYKGPQEYTIEIQLEEQPSLMTTLSVCTLIN